MQLKPIPFMATSISPACGGSEAVPPTCPSLEVAIVAEMPSDSARVVALSNGKRVVLTGSPLLTSADVASASASLTEGQYVLNLNLTADAARRVQVFSEQNVGRTMAFLVDGRIIRTPTIKDPITGNGFLIGAFERPEAERLADALNGGCMP
jgi:preprotein translocase subunit SecD